jgi:hypothetical protein
MRIRNLVWRRIVRDARWGSGRFGATRAWIAAVGPVAHGMVPAFAEAAMDQELFVSLSATTSHDSSPRRVVLVDFDWRDADLLPELLARPGLSVRLVAGERSDGAGLKMAELCELPRTTDLADLTREIFDLAVVSERSPRRTQIEGLLLALGTPCVSPESLLHGANPTHADTPAVEAPLALHAIAFESALGGADFGDLIEQALPDISDGAPSTPRFGPPAGRIGLRMSSLADFPSIEDRQGLERALAELASGTGARAAELRAGRSGDVTLLVRVGDEDPLLAGLIDLALSENTPQIISRLTGPHEGKAWGAWPFRTTRSRGVIAAAAIDPASGWTTWQQTVEELRQSWDLRDREQTAPAFPLVPDEPRGWLDLEGFRTTLSLAVARNQRDGLSFAVHRFELANRPEALGLLCEQLPSQLRDTDRLFRPEQHVVLLLTTCTLEAFEPVRRRITALWETVWHGSGGGVPAPAFVESRTGMTEPAEADRFLATASRWLSL